MCLRARLQEPSVAVFVPVAPPTAACPHPVGRLVRLRLRRLTEQAGTRRRLERLRLYQRHEAPYSRERCTGTSRPKWAVSPWRSRGGGGPPRPAGGGGASAAQG